MSDNAPLDSRAIGNAAIVNKKEKWKTILGYCPLCWWRLASEFHESASEQAAEKRLTVLHRKEKPDCHEKLGFVITDKK